MVGPSAINVNQYALRASAKVLGLLLSSHKIKFAKPAMPAFVLFLLTLLCVEASQLRARTSTNVDCRLTTVETSYENGDSTHEHACVPIVNGKETYELFTIELPQDLQAKYHQELSTGLLHVSLKNVSLRGETMVVDEKTQVRLLQDATEEHQRKLVEVGVTGTKSVVVVRVSTSDGVSPNRTLQELETGMFGENGFASQYSACSFQKLQLEFAGGVDVVLDGAISDYTTSAELVQGATDKLLQAYPYIESPAALADKVIFCQPPIGGWLAVAPVNHWRLNFNNEWCWSLSALMHEFGHSLGLTHSSTPEHLYGDLSGSMGFGRKGEYSPRKCFNGYRSHQLGWYSDRTVKIDPFTTSAPLTLTAFVDYDQTDDAVLLNVGDYYVFYNRAKAFNAETEAAEDHVTVTLGNVSSMRVGDLGEGDEFTVDDFEGSGQSLIIKVCERIDGDVDSMVVSIGMDATYCEVTAVSAMPVQTPQLPATGLTAALQDDSNAISTTAKNSSGSTPSFENGRNNGKKIIPYPKPLNATETDSFADDADQEGEIESEDEDEWTNRNNGSTKDSWFLPWWVIVILVVVTLVVLASAMSLQRRRGKVVDEASAAPGASKGPRRQGSQRLSVDKKDENC